MSSVAERPAQPTWKIREQLEKFVDILGKEHHIRTCQIRLCGVVTYENPNEILVPFEKARHHSEGGWENICLGSRVSTSPRAYGMGLSTKELEVMCRQSVDVDQQVLEPLTKLRGVQNVKIEGRITEDWAEYLKICMEGELGTTLGIEVFEHRTPVQWLKPTKRKKRGRK